MSGFSSASSASSAVTHFFKNEGFQCAVRALTLFALFSSVVQAGQITLSIDDITSPVFHARSISATLDGAEFSHFEARIGELALRERIWRKVRLSCSKTQWNNGEILCDQGELDVGEKLPVRFAYQQQSKTLMLVLDLPRGENWQFAAQWGKPGWRVRLDARNGQLARLAGFLPLASIRPTAGTWSGSISLDGSRAGVGNIVSDVAFKDLAFADASGLHAGEKVSGQLRFDAKHGDKAWHWHGELDWASGEVFWQPLYFAKGGHHFAGQGSLEADLLRIDQGSLRLAEVGEARLAGAWDMTGRGLTEFDLKATGLDVTGLYRILLKPFLDKTAFAKLQANGGADLAWRYHDGASTDFDLTLHMAEFIDEDQRFALHGVNARIPWSSTQEGQAVLDFQSGEVLHLTLGATHVPMKMQGWRFSSPGFSVPLLDGRLNIDDFSAGNSDGTWQWNFSGGLAPVSMERFSAALSWPLMHGTLSGIIPAVSYDGRNLKINGALLFKVFDGTAVVKDLALREPFGRAPSLSATLDMRNLDLDLLTSAFSFGNMQGRLDVAVAGLELSNWRPVRFDARVASSPGSYPKKISQRAVQNISALGGAGAAAAIQRSFLSFFEQFGYERIGLSCVLRNGICLMDGVEPVPHGYVIVQGGGIPAINVIGYNREVSWDELLERLKRVTQKNVEPIVR